MSLYALPVSVNDLEQLQLGIEFFTNTNEATTEAGLINQKTPTVDSYAVQLLGNNISFSQVAMAVDSLDDCGIYFGTTGGQVYASTDGGDSWKAIVRDLPAVLSVEVQTLT